MCAITACTEAIRALSRRLSSLLVGNSLITNRSIKQKPPEWTANVQNTCSQSDKLHANLMGFRYWRGTAIRLKLHLLRSYYFKAHNSSDLTAHSSLAMFSSTVSCHRPHLNRVNLFGKHFFTPPIAVDVGLADQDLAHNCISAVVNLPP